jgi:hypothetical protein
MCFWYSFPWVRFVKDAFVVFSHGWFWFF